MKLKILNLKLIAGYEDSRITFFYDIFSLGYVWAAYLEFLFLGQVLIRVAFFSCANFFHMKGNKLVIP